jgi:hypothetical protein
MNIGIGIEHTGMELIEVWKEVMGSINLTKDRN